MFSQYEPNVKASIRYLKLLKVNINNTTETKVLQSHPDWLGAFSCKKNQVVKFNLILILIAYFNFL